MKELTKGEVRLKFLQTVKEIIDYWAESPLKRDTIHELLEGAVFNVLAILDGGNANIPSFIVTPNPNPEEKGYYINRGENWYPENYYKDVKCDIAGNLHGLFKEII